MPAGRPNRPLYDLLGQGDEIGRRAAPPGARAVTPAAPAAEPQATGVIEPKPRIRVPLTEATRSPAPESASVVRMPAAALYASIFVVAALLVLAWVGGVRTGRNAAEREWGQKYAGDIPISTEPLIPEPLNASSRTGNPGSDVNPTPAPGPPAAGLDGQPVSSAATDVYSARGFLANDPRERGLNYLYLARLDSDDAKRAVEYLTRNNFPAIAVRVEVGSDGSRSVDRSASGANNPARYDVVALRGLTREQYRSGQRQQIESEAARLGKLWRKHERGSSDFPKPQWFKY